MGEFRVIALVSAFNEGDIIGEVIRHLVEQDVLVYLLDNHSTDDTVEEASRWLGRGLLAIESFPADAGNGVFAWSAILRRKEALAVELEADWFMHQDADEVRQSPWLGLTLREAIRRVEEAGYNCIEFFPVHFVPVDNAFRRGADPVAHFRYHGDGNWFDLLQRKCWQGGRPVSLTALGGHDVWFDDRRVCPVQFLLRHYPIRSEAHGRTKVFEERRPRFDPRERAVGWHQQYDHVEDGHVFVRDPSELKRFDPDEIRAQLGGELEPREVGWATR